MFRVETPSQHQIAALRSKQEHLAALDRHFQQFKVGLLHQLTQEEGVSAQNLTSSSTDIVTASAIRWRELDRKGGLIYAPSAVEMLPEVDFQALDQRK